MSQVYGRSPVPTTISGAHSTTPSLRASPSAHPVLTSSKSPWSVSLSAVFSSKAVCLHRRAATNLASPDSALISAIVSSLASPTTSRNLDVGDGDSEAAVATDEDVLRVVGPLELVVSFRVEAGNMLVRNAEDPVAWLAVLGLDLAEEEGEGALRVVGLPGDRDAEVDVEGMVEAKRGTGAVLDCHQRPAGQLLVKNVVYYSPMYWYICRLDASHRCPVVNKDCRLSPSTSLSSSWFLSFAYIALVVLSPSLEANDP